MRKAILDSSNGGGYYRRILPYLSDIQLNQFKNLAEIPKDKILNHLYIVPELKPANPCCAYAYKRRFLSPQEYSYILDFDQYRAKFSMQQPRCNCFGFGHLRALRVTALSKNVNNSTLPLAINTPLSYFPAGAPIIFVELWLHTDLSLLDENCSSKPEGEAILIPELVPDARKHLVDGKPITVKAELVDPKGNLRVEQETVIEWNNRTVRTFVDPRDGHKRDFYHGERQLSVTRFTRF